MKKVTILMLLASICLFNMISAEDVKLKQVSDGYTLDFTIPAYTIQGVDQYGFQMQSPGAYTSIYVDDYLHLTTDLGKPATPQFQFQMIVYDENSVPAIEVSNVVEENIILPNHIYPAQVEWPRSLPIEQRPFNLDFNYYKSHGVRGPMVTIGEVENMRDLRIVTVSISPFFYNPALKTLTVAKKFSVKFTTPVNNKVKPVDSEMWDKFFRAVCVNYDQIVEPRRDLGKKENYLVIAAPTYSSALSPYVEQKSKRYAMNVVTTATAGTTSAAIQAYIKTQYDNAATKPAFVLIVGCGKDVPLATPSGTPSDMPYGAVTGAGDWKPDIFYGRFDVSTVDELNNLINKTVFMENNLMNIPKRACLIGGVDAGSGKIAEGTHNYSITTYLQPKGFNTLKLYVNSDASATKDKFVKALNDTGLIWAIYSGHGSATSWAIGKWSYSTTDAKAATNTKAFPFSAGHACYTGSFHSSSVCFSQGFTRNKGGSVIDYASSVTTNWGGDDNVQRGMFDAIVKKVYAFGAAYIAGQVKNNQQTYFKQYNFFGDPSIYVEPDSMLTSIANKNAPEIRYSSFKVVGNNLALTITYKGEHTVQLLNPMGRVIASHKGFGAAQYKFPVTLGTGIYLLRISADKQKVVRIPIVKN